MRSILLFVSLALGIGFNLAGCPNTTPPPPPERGTLETQATAPASAEFGETVTLAAQATNSADGGQLFYDWIQTAGPGVRINNADTARASFDTPSLQTQQTLQFRVTTRNDLGDLGNAAASVTVAADPNFEFNDGGSGGSNGGDPSGTPHARAGADQEVDENTRVALSGAASTGHSLTFRWRQTTGPSVTLSGADTAVATFTAPSFVTDGANTLEFELRVKDAEQRESADRVRVTIKEPAGGGGAAGVRVRFTTNLGSFTLELDAEKAPLTVQNFLQYVDDKFYDGTLIHRVVPAFVVQGGGYLPGMTPKTTRDPIQNEAGNGLSNLRGTVAMARTAEPNSATSQFFVNLTDNTSLDKSAANPGYAVFGRVIEGMSVIDQIATLPTTTKNGFTDVPVDDVIIQSATRVASP